MVMCAVEPGFGGAPQASMFGGGQTSAFGAAAPAASAGGTGLFGASGGFMTSGGGIAGSGTTIKFVPVTGSDVVMKGGSQQTVQTKLQCITGMKEYENKSLEVCVL
jgi:nuclear pore complex protein Nup98-Nup96